MTETLTHDTRTAGSVWTDEVAQPLTCTRVDQVTHDVRSFTFTLPQPLRFEAGQYVTVELDVDGQRMERCYTISSSPSRPGELTITVKRVPGGPVSNWLHDRVTVGDAIPVRGPLGQFSTASHPAARYLFLSAGSGITPLMSMTRELYDQAAPADVVFVHNARTPRDIIFRQELATLATAPFLSVTAVCQDDAPDERWDGPRGLLTMPMLLRFAPDLYEREIFVCGPPPYMRAVRDMLGAAGVSPSRCHEESFTLASPDGEPETGPTDATSYAVELRRSGRTVTCDSGTTVLEAVSRDGVFVPSSCGEGVCGTCKSTLLGGSVDMQHAGGIRPREIAEDKILLCCSTPLENLVIDA